MAENNKEKEKVVLVHGFCNPTCEDYKKVEIPYSLSPTGKDMLELCCNGGTKRSFGCLNRCPKAESRII